MHWFRQTCSVTATLALLALPLAGCGTTRSTDTNRTATEQLLVSDAIDRALQSMDLQTLSGQTVFLDDSKLADVVDKNYLISSLRQYLLANGCSLRDKREEADFVVEARAGAVGTDRSDLLFGLPSMNVPQIALVQPVAAVIPEIPIAKRKDQRGIAKIAVFAYHRQTGAPVWQSGLVHQESTSNDVWILGAGPFQRGTIYAGTEFAGSAIHSEESKEKHWTPSASAGRPGCTRTRLSRRNNSPSKRRRLTRKLCKRPTRNRRLPHRQLYHSRTHCPEARGRTNRCGTTESPARRKQPRKQPAVPASPQPSGLSAIADPTKSQAAKSAYLQPADAATLPQPRFNSPQ